MRTTVDQKLQCYYKLKTIHIESAKTKEIPHVFQIYHVSNRQSSRLKVVDNHPCDFFYLTRLFQYLLAPPKHFTVILMFSPIGKDFFF